MVSSPESLCTSRRYEWFGLQPCNLDWWGAISYTLGVGMYQIAAIASIINDCPNRLLSVDAYVSPFAD